MPWQEDMGQKVMGSNPRADKGFLLVKFVLLSRDIQPNPALYCLKTVRNVSADHQDSKANAMTTRAPGQP